MLKELTLADLIQFIDDNQEVDISAYNIPLYDGLVRNIPAIYAPYPIVERMYTRDDKLIIKLDC